MWKRVILILAVLAHRSVAFKPIKIITTKPTAPLTAKSIPTISNKIPVGIALTTGPAALSLLLASPLPAKATAQEALQLLNGVEYASYMNVPDGVAWIVLISFVFMVNWYIYKAMAYL